MAKYLTPAQYLRADEGIISIGTLSTNALRRFIRQSEAMIDAYVGLDARLGGFEPHTVWHQSQWDKDTLRTRIPTWPVPVRNVSRYRIQVSMSGSSGNGFFANINNGDVAFNAFDSYLEIVPLQAVLYSMLPVLVQLGLDPPLIQLDATVGYYLDNTNDIFDDAGDHTTYYAQRGFWATSYGVSPSIQPNTLPACATAPGYVIFRNGTPKVSGTDYSVDLTEGSVTFTTPGTGSDIVTGNYTNQIPDAVTGATIAQVTWLLSQRELTLQGMKGLQSVITDQQKLERYQRVQINESPYDEPMMDPQAMLLLAPYRQIAIG